MNALWLTAPLFRDRDRDRWLSFRNPSSHSPIPACRCPSSPSSRPQAVSGSNSLPGAVFLHRRSASDLVGRDDSTGIPNRRLFLEHLQSAMGQAERESQGLATAMVRIDDFAAFEKQYGTEAADACLRRVAHALMRAGRRPLDYSARYSPKDYAVLFYDPSGKSITETVGRIRRQVAMLDIPNEATPDSKRVTVSIGVAVSPRGRKHHPRSVLTCAARALEKAQNLGRDKMVVEEVPERRSTAQILAGPWSAATRG